MQVLELCFKLYESKELSVRSTAGVAIRQIVSSLFERLDCLVEEEGVSGSVNGSTSQLPIQASDAYLLFQVSLYTTLTCCMYKGIPVYMPIHMYVRYVCTSAAYHNYFLLLQ